MRGPLYRFPCKAWHTYGPVLSLDSFSPLRNARNKAITNVLFVGQNEGGASITEFTQYFH